MSGFRFATPWALALLPLIAALVWTTLRRGRGQAALAYPSLTLVKWSKAARPSWESRIPLALTALGMLLTCVAVARPQWGTERELIKHSGVDIMLVLDTSDSMQAMDMQPNRLEAAKAISREFALGRPSDRIGLVVFSGTAFTQCPLTTDHAALSELLENAHFGMTGVPGTAIGNGLATAVNRLKSLKSKSRIAILLTDGANTAGEIDPMMAARLARELNVKVYTIGIGSPIPRPGDPFSLTPSIGADFDVETLTKIAGETGGKYFGAEDNRALEEVYREIDRLEKVEHQVERVTDYRELFAYPLAAGLALLVMSCLLERTFLRELP